MDKGTMKKLHEIEERSAAINTRMMDIFEELRSFRNDAERTNNLAEELAKLMFEAKVINCSLRFFQETAKKLMTEPCHGPH